MNLCLHHKFILGRRCQFSSQILAICGKFWFSTFIQRKLLLKLIECSQVFTMRLHNMKNFFFWRFRIGIITCWRLVPNTWRIARIIGSDWTSHFQALQSNGNDSEARKLGFVRFKAERRWTAFLSLWKAALKSGSEGVFTSYCDRQRKMDPLRWSQAQKIMGNAQTCLHVDGYIKNSRRQGYALHLVGPAGCDVLWAV